jgi:hypothetical protein
MYMYIYMPTLNKIYLLTYLAINMQSNDRFKLKVETYFITSYIYI